MSVWCHLFIAAPAKISSGVGLYLQQLASIANRAVAVGERTVHEMTGASGLGTAMQSVARMSSLKNRTRSPGLVPVGTFATCKRRAARVRCKSSFCKHLLRV